jgi:hypothetical protein
MFPGPAESDDLFVSAVAEYADEFLHFSWGSTA